VSKKIIIVGPPGAGKTTLRKVFFEGESSTKLLEYALEPTYGEESLILRLPGLNQDVGIFDLAGQENERWLNSDEQRIFLGTRLILVVIDITSSYNDISKFIRKMIDIRNTITASTNIFVLLHKMDLISEKKVREVKFLIKDEFSNETLIDFLFTSLKREFFAQTFSNFIDIMKVCLQDIIPDDGLLLNIVDESIKLIYHIDKEVLITKEKLQKQINRPEKLVNYLVENLVNKGHIEIKRVEDKDLLSLTNKGKLVYNKILSGFSSTPIKTSKGILETAKLTIKESVPSIIGAIIADKDGRSLLKFELFDDALKEFISQNIPNDDTIIPIDLELIPMFISALEKFSLELNIQNLTGFGLKGSNLKMNIFSFEDFTVTLFMNPNINLKAIENKIDNYFKKMFEENRDKFDNAIKTGNLTDLIPIKELGRNWLDELNNSYQSMIINSEFMDKENAQILYNKIDELYDDIKKEFSIALEKVKKLKVNIMKSIVEKDYEELKKIATVAQGLLSKFLI
jgi:GTPase SAR1 family protein